MSTLPSLNRRERLARLACMKGQIGYRRRPQYSKGQYDGKSAIVAGHYLDRQFAQQTPDQVWGTEFTYIKAYEI